jgi:NitT/TauT family transport system ATP-binding protein
VIFVTHSIEEAVYVSDQVALLGPRPSTIMRIIETELGDIENVEDIRRDKRYLDVVEDLWQILKQYLV